MGESPFIYLAIKNVFVGSLITIFHSTRFKYFFYIVFTKSWIKIRSNYYIFSIISHQFFIDLTWTHSLLFYHLTNTRFYLLSSLNAHSHVFWQEKGVSHINYYFYLSIWLQCHDLSWLLFSLDKWSIYAIVFLLTHTWVFPFLRVIVSHMSFHFSLQ